MSARSRSAASIGPAPPYLTRKGARGRILVAAGFVMLVLLLAIVQFASFNTNRQTRQLVNQSYERDLLFERLLTLIQDVETAQRGYSLTGEQEFLQPYERARPQIAPTFARLKRRLDDPASKRLVAELEQLISAKVAHSDTVIRARRDGTRQDAAELVGQGEGRVIMEAFRARVASLRTLETRHQNKHYGNMLKAEGDTFYWTIAIETLLLAVLLLAFFAYLNNYRRLAAVTRSTVNASRRQAAIFDAAGDAMLVTDEDGAIEGFNPAAERLFALDSESIKGRAVDELFAGGVYIAGRNERRSENRPGVLSHAEGVRGDGSRFEAEIAASTVRLEDEVKTLLVIRDSTERNRVERMKNEFVSTVSHELRTPLTSIRGAIGLLEHALAGSVGDQQAQLLTIARSNSERLSRLIDDILDIEKVGSGRLRFDMQPIDLRDVVHDAEVHNRTYAADRKVRLIVTVQSEPLPVRGDPGRIVQVLTNLISNAAKYSPEGGVVSVVAERQQGAARVIVADQGPGIPVDFRPRLFDRFSQAQGPAQRAGTGLGLAIAREIVERHGGLISYETAVGKGTRFWIDLPLAEDESA